jgi:hypothetical protein
MQLSVLAMVRVDSGPIDKEMRSKSVSAFSVKPASSEKSRSAAYSGSSASPAAAATAAAAQAAKAATVHM